MLDYKNIGRMYIGYGKKIILDSPLNQFEREYNRIIIRVALSVLLFQLNAIPFHGSSVTLANGKNLLILGDSKAGKSTLARYICNQGGKLLSDDMSCIDVKGSKMYLLPSFPEQRFWEDMKLHYDKSLAFSKELRGTPGKYMINDQIPFEHNRRGLDGIIALEKHGEIDDIHVSKMSMSEKLDVLIKQTFQYGVLPYIGKERSHFDTIKAMIHKPFYTIKRCEGPDTLEQIYDTIKEIY